MAAAGAENTLIDPALALHASNGFLLAANDNCREHEVEATSAPPQNDRESALVA